MIVIIILWSLIFILSSICGAIFIYLIDASNKIGEVNLKTFPILLILGLVGLSAVVGYLSLLMPVGFVVLIVLVGLMFLFFSFHRSLIKEFLSSIGFINRNPYLMTSLVFSFIPIVLSSTYSPDVYDTGLYHAQSVRWIEEYRAVPGLGNLHVRLAFNSSWSLLTALFSLRSLANIPFHALNGYFTLVCLAFMLGIQNQFLSHRNRVPSLVAAFMIGALLYFGIRGIPSIDQDQPAMLLLWVIFLLFISRQMLGGREIPYIDIALIILSVFAITIKLSTVPVLLIPVFLLCQHFFRRDYRFVIVSLVAGFLILLPWVVRNVLLSGYMIYPFAGVDILNVDWKIPSPVVSNQQAEILAWARIPHRNMHSVLAMSAGEWLPIWFYNYPPFLHMLLFLSFFGNIVLFFSGLKKSSQAPDRTFLPIVFIIGIAFWFLNAPDYRFGLGLIIPAAILPLASLLNGLINRAGIIALKITNILLKVWTLLFLVFAMAVALVFFSALASPWLIPAGYPPPVVHLENVNGLSVFVPDTGDQCWDAPLPCTPYPHSGFVLRGTNLQDGFRMVLTEEQLEAFYPREEIEVR